MSALQKRLHLVRKDALVSAQLMHCRQEPREAADMYAQTFEQLFKKSIKTWMYVASTATLKCDLFVPGLHLQWQDRVLPSAEPFEDALFQAWIAEQKQLDLAHLHRQQSRHLLPHKTRSTQHKSITKYEQSNIQTHLPTTWTLLLLWTLWLQAEQLPFDKATKGGNWT